MTGARSVELTEIHSLPGSQFKAAVDHGQTQADSCQHGLEMRGAVAFAMLIIRLMSGDQRIEFRQKIVLHIRIGVALKRAIDADAFNLHLADGSCAGQVVMHAHLHVVPRSTDDSFHWNWRQLKYESDAARDEIAEKMRKAFKLNPDADE